MTRRNIDTILLTIATILTGAFLLGIAFNVTPWLRGPEEWRWPYVIPGTINRLWLSITVLTLYVLFILWWDRQSLTRSRKILALLLASAITPVLQLSLLYLDHTDVYSQLFLRTVSELSGGFFNVGAVVTDNRDFLTNFAARMDSFPIHPQRHPPGLPLLFASARQLFDQTPELAAAIGSILRPYQCHNLDLMSLPNSAIASATVQMLVPFLLALVVWGLYFFGHQVYDEKTSLRAALLWPLLPSIALWATRWNQLYALFTLLAALLFHLGLTRRRAGAIFLSGFVVSLGTFFSFGNVVIAGFLGIYALVWLITQTKRPSLRWLAGSTALFFLGLSTVWILAWVSSGLNLFDIWNRAMQTHLGLGRSYLTWLFYHPYDFFIFLGIPLFIFWCAQVVKAILDWRKQRYDLLTISFAIALLLIILSGTSQGEVARVWAFLLPLALLSAVRRIPRRGLIFSGVVALMAVQVLVSNIFLQPVSTGLLDAPTPPTSGLSEIEAPAAIWENNLILERVTMPETVAAGQAIPIEVVWNSGQQIDRPFTIFIHLLDEQDQLAAQHDGMALNGEWPTTCWQDGQPFSDTYELLPEAGTQPGIYQVQIGFYWLPSGERLPLIKPAGRIDHTFDAGTIRLENGS